MPHGTTSIFLRSKDDLQPRVRKSLTNWHKNAIFWLSTLEQSSNGGGSYSVVALLSPVVLPSHTKADKPTSKTGDMLNYVANFIRDVTLIFSNS